MITVYTIAPFIGPVWKEATGKRLVFELKCLCKRRESGAWLERFSPWVGESGNTALGRCLHWQDLWRRT